MAKMKQGSWTPDEVSQVREISKDANTSTKLEKLSKKLRRPYANVYAKWNTERKKREALSGKVSNPAPVMELKFDPNYDGKNSSIDNDEKNAFEKGLEKQLSNLLPYKGAVIIPRRMEKIAKEYVNKHHPDKVYGLSAIQKNNREKRFFRKA